MSVILAFLSLWQALWFSPQMYPFPGVAGRQPASGGLTAITLDASCTGSASAASVAACSSPMTVTAGDTITCEGYKNNNFDPGNLYFNDPVNGYYAAVYGYVHPTSANEWVGGAVFENSASGSITPQVWNWESTGIGISCQAWKGTPTVGTLDGGAVNLTRSATAANPTSGTAASPTNANEVVLAQVVRATAATTSNSAPWLPSGTLTGVTQTLAQYFQYQIQTTSAAANGNMTSASAAFRDTQFALINASSSGGAVGLTGLYGAPANAQTNAATATLAILNTISGATAGSLTPLNGTGAGNAAPWTQFAGSAVTFATNAGAGATVAPLGSLQLMVNQQLHTLGDAATAIHFLSTGCPGSCTTSAYNYAPEGFVNTGTDMWLGMFVYVNGTLTAGQGCDIFANEGSLIDNAQTLQLNFHTGTGACTGLNSGICLDIEDQASGTGAALTTIPNMASNQGYFIIEKAGGVGSTTNDIYVLGEATPGTLPWVVIGHSTKNFVTTAVATTTGSVTAGSAALTVASGTGVAIGQSIGMAGVLAGTTITAGSGTSWTLSQAANTNESSVAAKFWAASGGPYNFQFGKYSSCSLNNDVYISSVIYDPYGVLLPQIAAGTLGL